MKNRRSIIVAFLVVAMLVASIGYAAVSATLQITGAAKYNPDAAATEFRANVYFSGGEKVAYQSSGDPAEDLVSTSTWGEGVMMAAYEVESLVAHGEYVIFKFEITKSLFYQ